jgi:hypothetical protein
LEYPAPEELLLVGDSKGLDAATVDRLRERGATFLFCLKRFRA